MMTHGAMLWGAALYNNGSFHLKDPRFGESYSESGAPQTAANNDGRRTTHERFSEPARSDSALGDLATGKRSARV
jgi:hypothetical protein